MHHLPQSPHHIAVAHARGGQHGPLLSARSPVRLLPLTILFVVSAWFCSPKMLAVRLCQRLYQPHQADQMLITPRPLPPPAHYIKKSLQPLRACMII